MPKKLLTIDRVHMNGAAWRENQDKQTNKQNYYYEKKNLATHVIYTDHLSS